MYSSAFSCCFNTRPLPAKYARLPSFNTQPGAEGLEAGVFQQLHYDLWHIQKCISTNCTHTHTKNYINNCTVWCTLKCLLKACIRYILFVSLCSTNDFNTSVFRLFMYVPYLPGLGALSKMQHTNTLKVCCSSIFTVNQYLTVSMSITCTDKLV